jgi:sugar lactone lactonase YvrE
VFVADATLKRVFGYASDGRFSIAIGHDGELASPSGLAVDRANKRLYVADAARHRILSYSTVDGSPGPTIGKRGSEPGEFNYPTNLAVDARGRLYVTDTLNFRIQIFDAQGRFVSTFGTLGDTPGCLNRPKGIGVDSEGHIYVIDASFNNFQIFDERGQLLLFVGAGGNSPGEFFLPAGLFIDERDRIYVADQGNSRVQVFQYVNAGGGTLAVAQEGAGK